jgi:predicted RNase H-like nuclease (RuvC/YqgF family)
MDGEDELKKQEMNLHNLSEKYEKGIQNLKQSLERLRESVDRLSSFTDDMKNENM